MAAEDYMPFDAYCDEEDDDPEGYDTRSKCNGCGTPIEWVMTGTGWKPFNAEDGGPHSCAPMRREYADADDFEDLTGDLS